MVKRDLLLSSTMVSDTSLYRSVDYGILPCLYHCMGNISKAGIV